MYDISFDLNNMHQTVDESDEVDGQFWHIGETFDFGVGEEEIDDYPVIVKKSKYKSDGNGCVCPDCKEHFPYAEPNELDGSFKCWSCRNPLR